MGSGAWSQEGVILFGRRGVGGLNRVSENGGPIVPVTAGGFSGFPSFLPDGQQFPLLPSGATPGVFAGSLDNKPDDQPTTPVLVTDVAAQSVPASNPDTGYMFFVRDQTLMAQPFDQRTLTLAGEAAAINRAPRSTITRRFRHRVNGRLAYRTVNPSTSQQLTWFTREGKSLSTIGAPGGHEQLALSPDGTRAIYRDVISTRSRGDLWVIDLKRGINERFTSELTVGGFPVWSPNGGHVAFRSGQDLFQKPSSGGRDAERLLKSYQHKDSPTSWSPDGKFLLFTTIGLNSLFDINVLTIDAAITSALFLKTQYNESQAMFSPDGQWVTSTSNESGRNEVYVRPFTPPGAERTDRRQVASIQRGRKPARLARGWTRV